MTLELILDENIIEFSAKLENERGNGDSTCLGLLSDILRRCDYVHCTKELLKNYRKKLKQLENNMIKSSSATVKLLEMMMYSGKLIIHNPDPPRLPNEKDIPPDDVYLVRLAVSTRATLVSADVRLKTRLDAGGLIRKHDIKIKHPSEI